MRFSTSRDPVGAPIFYRDVPLMPGPNESGNIQPLDKGAVPLIGWRLRDIARPESKLVLSGMPSCANCHSFSLDGKTLGMDVDGPQGDKGAYAIAPIGKTTVIDDENVITWNAFEDKPAGHKTIGFLSRISPDGQYAVTTLNESLYVANFTNYKFLQVFYPTRGILAWYSRKTGEMKALPGADDTSYVQCDPAWSPDGKSLVFARAKAFDPYRPGQKLATYANDPNEPDMRYDLYRIAFDEGRGGTPVRDRGRVRERHEQHLPEGLAGREVDRLHEVQERPAHAARRPAVDRAVRGRRGARDALQHRAHELLAQLLPEQPLDGVLLQDRTRPTRRCS